MDIRNQPHQLLEKEKAIELAETLNEEDDEWFYLAIHCPNGTGFSFIEIYEEKDGEFIAKL